MINTPNKIILKFDQVCIQTNLNIRKLSGLVRGRYLIDLINVADLEANPRESKVGEVTNAIMESLEKTPEVFPFKTKGILIASSSTPKELDRHRYEISFNEPGVDGILDGGHNTLAIGLYILNLATDDSKEIKKIRTWEQFSEKWPDYRAEVNAVKKELDFLVPVELLVPENDDELSVEIFKGHILDICSARNNNAQLTGDTQANQAGHFDYVKDKIDPKIRNEVIWKSNTAGRIPVRDIVNLDWIALKHAKLPSDVTLPPDVTLYSSKAKSMSLFVDLMKNEEVSNKNSEKYELKNSSVGSAIAMLKDLPELYDYIYLNLPHAYNSLGGKFGKITAVKKYDPVGFKTEPKAYTRTKPTSPFYGVTTDWLVPDGFVMPLFVGLGELIDTDSTGNVIWIVNPKDFLKKHFTEIVAQFKFTMEMAEFDPQKVGKNAGSYSFSRQQFKTQLIQHRYI